jgi:hypothetical protein
MKVEKHFFSRKICRVNGMEVKRSFWNGRIKQVGPMKVQRGWWGRIDFDPLLDGYSSSELAALIRTDDRLMNDDS